MKKLKHLFRKTLDDAAMQASRARTKIARICRQIQDVEDEEYQARKNIDDYTSRIIKINTNVTDHVLGESKTCNCRGFMTDEKKKAIIKSAEKATKNRIDSKIDELRRAQEQKEKKDRDEAKLQKQEKEERNKRDQILREELEKLHLEQVSEWFVDSDNREKSLCMRIENRHKAENATIICERIIEELRYLES